MVLTIIVIIIFVVVGGGGVSLFALIIIMAFIHEMQTRKSRSPVVRAIQLAAPLADETQQRRLRAAGLDSKQVPLFARPVLLLFNEDHR
jgi:hypothetical protein